MKVHYLKNRKEHIAYHVKPGTLVEVFLKLVKGDKILFIESEEMY